MNSFEMGKTLDDFKLLVNSEIKDFFDKIHWIRIKNLKDLLFRIEQPIVKNIEQKQLLFDYLSKYSEISQKRQYFI